jgi:hypothetical protein
MNVPAQHSAHITSEQWEAFEVRIEDFHPDDSYTEDQKAFLRQLMNEDGQLSRDARLSLTMIRDELAFLLPQERLADLHPFRAMPKEGQIELLMGLRRELKIVLQARQDALPNDGLNPQQEKFKFLEIHEDSFPLCLLLDIGWCLGFRYQPKSNSWHLAGKAYLLGEMCRHVFLLRNPQAADELIEFRDRGGDREGDDYEGMMGGDEGEEVEDVPASTGDEIPAFVANAVTSSKLKACVFYVWHEKYAAPDCHWSVKHMCHDWLFDAMELFSVHTKKTYHAACFPMIAHTAENTWIGQLVTNSRIPSATPAGDWVQSLTTPAKAGATLRKEWICYWSRRLAMKRVEPPKTAKRLSEATGTSTSAQGRRNVRQAIEGLPPKCTTGGATAVTPGPIVGTALSNVAAFQAKMAQQRLDDRELLQKAVENEAKRQQMEEDRHKKTMDLLQALTNQISGIVNQASQRSSGTPPAFVFSTPQPYYQEYSVPVNSIRRLEN